VNASALLKLQTCRPTPGSAQAATEPARIYGRPDLCSQRGRQAQVSAEATRILDDVRRAIKCNPEGARAAALQLVSVLTPPAETESAGARGGLAPWQKRRVDRYLSEHLGRSLHTEEIARQVSLSASHFGHAFKESYGTSPHKHIIGLRLELAQRLMLTTEDPLSQIALVCGTADQSHLSKLFRRGVGETPAAWRRRHLHDAEAEARSRRSKARRSFSLGV
jgi:AraC family transcriptional regulator